MPSPLIHSAHKPTLHLVPPRPHRSPLALWHLLSLDAPTVATLWTWFLARCAHIALPWTGLTAMFLAVWMLYVADRLLDARSANEPLEERHRFHARHSRWFLPGICIAGIALGCLLFTLNAEALHLCTFLGTLLAVWLLLVHFSAVRLPKELGVGFFVAAAVCIPTVARESSIRLTLLSPAICLALTASLNCLYLYAWEHPRDRSRAHTTTRWALTNLHSLTAAAVLVCAITSTLLHSTLTFTTLASALSCALLALLNHQRRRFSRVHLRALADAALLTPLLFAPFLRS